MCQISYAFFKKKIIWWISGNNNSILLKIHIKYRMASMKIRSALHNWYLLGLLNGTGFNNGRMYSLGKMTLWNEQRCEKGIALAYLRLEMFPSWLWELFLALFPPGFSTITRPSDWDQDIDIGPGTEPCFWVNGFRQRIRSFRCRTRRGAQRSRASLHHWNWGMLRTSRMKSSRSKIERRILCESSSSPWPGIGGFYL